MRWTLYRAFPGASHLGCNALKPSIFLPFSSFREVPIHYKVPYVSSFNYCFISLDARDSISIETSFDKIRDLLAQLQRKAEKPGEGERWGPVLGTLEARD